jgi:hypothetical protein
MEIAIKPSDINIDYDKGFDHLWDAFGNSETEVSAYWLVKLAQRRGNWSPFTIADIQALYREKFPQGDFSFNRLIGKFIVFVPSGECPNQNGAYCDCGRHHYEFTPAFVGRCYASSPVKG